MDTKNLTMIEAEFIIDQFSEAGYVGGCTIIDFVDEPIEIDDEPGYTARGMCQTFYENEDPTGLADIGSFCSITLFEKSVSTLLHELVHCNELIEYQEGIRGKNEESHEKKFYHVMTEFYTYFVEEIQPLMA